MSDKQLACSALSWGLGGFVEAVSAISRIGYNGIECSARLVQNYEDRLHVFEEILDVSRLKLAAMSQQADLLSAETAEVEVERVANTARFLSANKADVLVVAPRNTSEEDFPADGWTTMAAILEEMGSRCNEFGVRLAFRPRAGFFGGEDREMKKVLSMADRKLVYLCADTAELALAKIQFDRFFKNHGERVVYVRLRDASGSKRRKAYTREEPGSAPQLGRGAVDFAGAGKTLEKNGYRGWLTLETAGESGVPREAAEAGFRFIVRKSGLFA